MAGGGWLTQAVWLTTGHSEKKGWYMMHAGSVAVICQSPKQTTSALNGADRAVFCAEPGANHVANTVAPLCLNTQTKHQAGSANRTFQRGCVEPIVGKSCTGCATQPVTRTTELHTGTYHAHV